MGTYTEILVRAQISRQTPDHVKALLLELFGEGGNDPVAVLAEHPNAPEFDHAFFRAPRWQAVGSCSSFYHIPTPMGGVAREGFVEPAYYIFHRSDLKNYDNEITLFWEWSRPYLVPATGRCVGWTWYEEAEAPTLVLRED